MLTKFKIPEVMVILLFASIVAIQLFFSPITGLANNGDFERIMFQENLQYQTNKHEEIYMNYIQKAFDISNTSRLVSEPYFSSEVLSLKFSLFLNNLFTDNKTFDIRYLGFTNAVLLFISLLLSIYLIRKQSLLFRCLFYVLFLFMFLDVGYVAYFNSFYSEAASYVYLFIFIGMFYLLLAKRTYSIAVYLGTVISAILFITGKIQNAPLGIIIMLLFIHLAWARKDILWKIVVITGSVAVLVFSIITYQSSPAALDEVTIFDSFFAGVLKSANDVPGTLNEFGVNQKYKELVGNAYYVRQPYDITTANPQFKQDFYDKVTHGKIIKYYFKHPDHLYKVMDITAKAAFNLRPDYLGNYEKEAGKGLNAKSSFMDSWSKFKLIIFPKHFMFLVAYFALYFLFLAYKVVKAGTMKGRLYYEGMIAIGLMAVMQFAIPIVSEGENELVKHLFLFNQLFDLTVFFLLTIFLQYMFKRYTRIQNKSSIC
ncbi:hypothetical protein ACFDTO_23540 [Microbacteriaceae bacterium 4G12]